MMKYAIRTAIVSLICAAAAWAQTPAGGEFRVNTYTTLDQRITRVAMEPDGDFVVVWSSSWQDGNGEGAFGQRFAASGAPRGSEFRINTTTSGTQWYPAVAVGSKGDFVVVWWDTQPYTVAQTIRGQRYDTVGDPIGAEFLVSASMPGFQYRPRVGRASDGRFIVSWASENGDGNFYGIVARRFEASGDPIGSQFVVNTYTNGAQIRTDIAVEANGNFVVVWEDINYRDGSGSAIFGQRYDGSGNRLGIEFRVNSYTTGFQRTPSVSVSPSGSFVVGWGSQFGDGNGSAAFARRFDALGNAVGSDFVVNTYTTGSQYSIIGIAHDARDNFVITWRGSGVGDAYGTFAQRFSASGARRGGEFQVNAYTTGFQGNPSVASDPLGNFVVAWEGDGQGDSGPGVFAQRFGGLRPAALAVDTPGNGVLDPGEAATVRPTWRNFNGAAQTFGGTLTNITGPAGAMYAITDPTGDYGPVPNGATGQCVDCYAVSVSDPPTRPAQHWDASAVESILPDSHGQQKEWVLHVGRSFTDVATSSGFYRFIETLLHHGITGGCGGSNYCPGQSTSREQMAVFVLVAKEGPGYTPPACGAPVFADVPANNPFCRFIEELARRGVVTGCGGGNYCPTQAVSREQMAVFVLVTLQGQGYTPAACTAPMFADVPANSPFCRFIEELARRGVVTGCGGTPPNYCPTNPVTREQMGVFISATFGLTLYGP